jgi:hypothetical protein
MNADEIRERLTRILAGTEGAAPEPHGIGSPAQLCQFEDDDKSPRRAMRFAHGAAWQGLIMLELGENEFAEMFLRGATDAYLRVLESVIDRKKLQDLKSPPGLRGRARIKK